MADAQLKLSRRALLGAACAAPVLSGIDRPLRAATPSVRSERSRGPLPSGAEALHLRHEWEASLTCFRSAEAALTALEGDPDEDAYGRAHDAFNLAFRRLLAAPAPDVAALADKLEIAAAAEAAETTYAPPDLGALAEDARRLAGHQG